MVSPPRSAPPAQIGAQLSDSPALKGSPSKNADPTLKGSPAEKGDSTLKGRSTENGNSPHKGRAPKNEESALKGKLPGTARKDKPPMVPGYEWSPQSRGFTCREVTGQGKDRQRRYIGFLSGKRWETMKASGNAADRRAAVLAWIAEKKRKG